MFPVTIVKVYRKIAVHQVPFQEGKKFVEESLNFWRDGMDISSEEYKLHISKGATLLNRSFWPPLFRDLAQQIGRLGCPYNRLVYEAIGREYSV